MVSTSATTSSWSSPARLARRSHTTSSSRSAPWLPSDGPAKRQVQELFDGEMTLGQVCDLLAYALPLPGEVKQAMLAEPHAGRRAAAIADALRVSAARADRLFPPRFSPN